MLVGRTESRLKEVETAITSLSKDAKVSVYACDVTDDEAVKRVAVAVGTWDAILHCAGYMNKPSPALKAELEDYWRAFEVITPTSGHF